MLDGTTAPQLRILLVEEQADARERVRLALERLRYRVESVADGRSALARARRDPPDLLVVSTTLPDLPGAAVIGALREMPATARVPVVAICEAGAAMPEARPERGAAACVCRPLEMEPLVRAIDSLAGSRAAPAAGDEPVLDLDHLRRITDGDPQLESELSALFASTSAAYLQDMRQALEEGRAWTSIAHALKGASANLGARRLAALALIAERSQPSRDQLEAIERAIEELRVRFESILAPSLSSVAQEESPREIP